MTDDDLIDFLRQNLRLEISDAPNFDTDRRTIKISLLLKNEEISSEKFSIYDP